jgi:hypothetical protein
MKKVGGTSFKPHILPAKCLSVFSCFSTFGRSDVPTCFPTYPLSFQTLAHSFALNKNSTLLFSSNSELFCKNHPGWGEGAISASRSIRGCLPSSVHSSKSPPSSQISFSRSRLFDVWTFRRSDVRTFGRSSALGRSDLQTFRPSDVPHSKRLAVLPSLACARLADSPTKY